MDQLQIFHPGYSGIWGNRKIYPGQ